MKARAKKDNAEYKKAQMRTDHHLILLRISPLS